MSIKMWTLFINKKNNTDDVLNDSTSNNFIVGFPAAIIDFLSGLIAKQFICYLN